MNASAAETTPTALGLLARIVGLALLVVAGAVVFAFAAAAALVIGLVVLGAAIGMRVTPQAKTSTGPETLDARHTPTGWVVETGMRRSS